MSRPGPSRPSLYGRRSELVNVGEAQTRVAPSLPDPLAVVGARGGPRYSGAMLRAGQRLAAIGTGVALVTTLGGPALAAPATPPGRGAPGRAARLPHPSDRRRRPDRGSEVHRGGRPDPVREVWRVGGDPAATRSFASSPTTRTTRPRALPPPAPAEACRGRRSTSPRGAGRPSGPPTSARQGAEVRVSTPEGSLTLPSGGSGRRAARPRPPGAAGGLDHPLGRPTTEAAATAGPPAGPGAPPQAPPPTLSDRPHLLQLASGVGDPGGRLLARGRGDPLPAPRRGRRVRAGRDRPAPPAGGRAGPRPARGPVRPPARARPRGGPAATGAQAGPADRRRAGLAASGSPASGDRALEDPWATLDRGLLVHLEFDRERSGPDGDWLAYLYLPSGRMLNAELIRVGLARPRTDRQNLRYVDLFEGLWTSAGRPMPAR